MIFILRLIGETTLDIGPGDWIWIAAGSWPGMVVAVDVGLGLGVSVGTGISVGKSVGRMVIAAWVAAAFAAYAVSAITVGKYSGGYSVGTALWVAGAKGEQPTKSPSTELTIQSRNFILIGKCVAPVGPDQIWLFFPNFLRRT
jgi:hypothetical protein